MTVLKTLPDELGVRLPGDILSERFGSRLNAFMAAMLRTISNDCGVSYSASFTIEPFGPGPVANDGTRSEFVLRYKLNRDEPTEQPQP